MTRKIGTDIDHALLMASIFRTSKYEDLTEYLKFVKDIRKKTRTRKDADKDLLTVDVPGQETKKDDDETGGGPETGGETKSPDEVAETKKEESKEEIPDTVDDRVFVCLGKAIDVPDLKQVWIMTINRAFNETTFWDPKQHRKFVLKGRIRKDQVVYLQNYLSPNLTPDQKALINKMREDARNARKPAEQEEVDPDLFAKGVLEAEEDEDDEEKEEDSDDKSDSDFQENIEKIINYSDMDQSFKGDDINNIGQIKALGKETAGDLRKLNYDDEDQKPGAGGGGGGEKKVNKFFQKQEENRKRDELMRPDKHLLPVEEFHDPITGELVVDDFDKLPFHTVDIIFNHKNIYANL